MMRFSKSLLLVLGVVAALGFLGVMIYNVIMINQLHAVAGSNRSIEYANPRNLVLIGAGLGLLAGLLLGMGIAMPSRSFKARYAEARRDEQIAEAKAAGFNGASIPADRTATDDPGGAAQPRA